MKITRNSVTGANANTGFGTIQGAQVGARKAVLSLWHSYCTLASRPASSRRPRTGTWRYGSA
jgi:hypothetical protein